MRLRTSRRRAVVAAPALGAVLVVLQALVWQLSPDAAAAGGRIEIVAVDATASDASGAPGAAGVWLVGTVGGPQLLTGGGPDVRVTAEGPAGRQEIPAQVRPLLSDGGGVAVVVDGTAEGARQLQAGGSAGVAGLLLQLPPAAATSVVADRSPPTVLAPPQRGPAAALRAVAASAGSGARATSQALTLAADQASAAGREPVVVLFTTGSDAGGESATRLAERLCRRHVVLAVVAVGADLRYWSEVAGRTGGVAVAATAAGELRAFDTVADALRSRFTVSFPRPGSAEVMLDVATPGVAPSALPITLPPPDPATHQAARGPARPPSTQGFTDRQTALAVVALCLPAVALAAGLLLRRRRAGPPGEDVEQSALADAQPSLFEDRATRDARLAAQRTAQVPVRSGSGPASAGLEANAAGAAVGKHRIRHHLPRRRGSS